jgi:hypothetical protein
MEKINKYTKEELEYFEKCNKYMSTKHKIEVMQSFVNGKTILMKSKNQKNAKWVSFEENQNPIWNWEDYNYKINNEKDILGNVIRKYYTKEELEYFGKKYVYKTQVYQVIRAKEIKKLRGFKYWELIVLNKTTNKVTRYDMSMEELFEKNFFK